MWGSLHGDLSDYILWSSKKIIADFNLPFTSASGLFFFFFFFFFFGEVQFFYLLNKKSWMYSNSPLQINTIIIFPEMPLKYLIVFHEPHKMMKNFRPLGAIASGWTFYWEALVFSLLDKSLVHVRITPWGPIKYHSLEAIKMINDFNPRFKSVPGHSFSTEKFSFYLSNKKSWVYSNFPH